jgi:dTDP-4-amino-4,6-dideoxygalactose transaminase
MNPYNVVKQFEEEIAKYCGAPYAVSVESCSAALFLCCKYFKVETVTIPKLTYPSVACSIINAGGRIDFQDIDWQENGYYWMKPYMMVDSAKFLARDMYKIFDKALVCLSFHSKKCIKIGRGGMILTDNKDIVEWFKWMRFDGRHECALSEDKLMGAGWNMYMTPEQAARGLELLQFISDWNIEPASIYNDLSKYEFFK